MSDDKYFEYFKFCIVPQGEDNLLTVQVCNLRVTTCVAYDSDDWGDWGDWGADARLGGSRGPGTP